MFMVSPSVQREIAIVNQNTLENVANFVRLELILSMTLTPPWTETILMELSANVS